MDSSDSSVERGAGMVGAQVALRTDIPAERVLQILQRCADIGSWEQRPTSQGDVWTFCVSDERALHRVTQVYEAVQKATQSLGQVMGRTLPDPGYFIQAREFDYRQGRHQVSPEFFDEASLLLSTRPSVCARDERNFDLLLTDPRDRIYVNFEEGPFIEESVVRILRNLRSKCNVLLTEDHSLYVGREREIREVMTFVEQTFAGERYDVWAIFGEYLQGKSTLASIVMQMLRQKYPAMMTMFVPAFQEQTNEPMSLLRKTLTAFCDVVNVHPDVAAMPEFRWLDRFAQQPDLRQRDELVRAFGAVMRRLGELGVPLLCVYDDAQWNDRESEQCLTRMFAEAQRSSYKNVAQIVLSRMGRVGENETVNPDFLRGMGIRQPNIQRLRPLLLLDVKGKPTIELRQFVCRRLDIDPATAVIDERLLIELARKAAISSSSGGPSSVSTGQSAVAEVFGNPGILRGVYVSMLADGVAAKSGNTLQVDWQKFDEWRAAGTADTVVASHVRRYMELPADSGLSSDAGLSSGPTWRQKGFRDILLHVYGFSLVGGCTHTMLIGFLRSMGFRDYEGLVEELITAAQVLDIQDRDDPTRGGVFFPNPLFVKHFGAHAVTQAQLPTVHYRISAYLSAVRRHVTDRYAAAGEPPPPFPSSCSSVVTYQHARAAYRMYCERGAAVGASGGTAIPLPLRALLREHAIDAFLDAYNMNNWSLALDIFQDIATSDDPEMRSLADQFAYRGGDDVMPITSDNAPYAAKLLHAMSLTTGAASALKRRWASCVDVLSEPLIRYYFAGVTQENAPLLDEFIHIFSALSDFYYREGANATNDRTRRILDLHSLADYLTRDTVQTYIAPVRPNQQLYFFMEKFARTRASYLEHMNRPGTFGMADDITECGIFVELVDREGGRDRDQAFSLLLKYRRMSANNHLYCALLTSSTDPYIFLDNNRVRLVNPHLLDPTATTIAIQEDNEEAIFSEPYSLRDQDAVESSAYADRELRERYVPLASDYEACLGMMDERPHVADTGELIRTLQAYGRVQTHLGAYASSLELFRRGLDTAFKARDVRMAADISNDMGVDLYRRVAQRMMRDPEQKDAALQREVERMLQFLAHDHGGAQLHTLSYSQRIGYFLHRADLSLQQAHEMSTQAGLGWMHDYVLASQTALLATTGEALRDRVVAQSSVFGVPEINELVALFEHIPDIFAAKDTMGELWDVYILPNLARLIMSFRPLYRNLSPEARDAYDRVLGELRHRISEFDHAIAFLSDEATGMDTVDVRYGTRVRRGKSITLDPDTVREHTQVKVVPESYRACLRGKIAAMQELQALL